MFINAHNYSGYSFICINFLIYISLSGNILIVFFNDNLKLKLNTSTLKLSIPLESFNLLIYKASKIHSTLINR